MEIADHQEPLFVRRQRECSHSRRKKAESNRTVAQDEAKPRLRSRIANHQRAELPNRGTATSSDHPSLTSVHPLDRSRAMNDHAGRYELRSDGKAYLRSSKRVGPVYVPRSFTRPSAHNTSDQSDGNNVRRDGKGLYLETSKRRAHNPGGPGDGNNVRHDGKGYLKTSKRWGPVYLPRGYSKK